MKEEQKKEDKYTEVVDLEFKLGENSSKNIRR